jgi:hypothetical protein
LSTIEDIGSRCEDVFYVVKALTGYMVTVVMQQHPRFNRKELAAMIAEALGKDAFRENDIPVCIRFCYLASKSPYILKAGSFWTVFRRYSEEITKEWCESKGFPVPYVHRVSERPATVAGLEFSTGN